MSLDVINFEPEKVLFKVFFRHVEVGRVLFKNIFYTSAITGGDESFIFVFKLEAIYHIPYFEL